jgi:putative transposase
LSRKRIEYPNAFYHVVQRGNNRENIFRRDADKYRYLNNLSVLKAKYDFKLLGYVLMDNHYHLLLQTVATPLHRIIFYQNMVYSRYFNKAYERTGHLYGDRYKAYLILDEKYLFSVLRYIHWNPCKAGLCIRPEEYKWSSDLYYRKDNAGIVDTEFIFKSLHTNHEKAFKNYNRLMKVMPDESEEAKLVSNPAIGVTVVNKKNEKEANLKLSLTAEQNSKPAEKLSLDQLLKETGVSEEDFKLIKSGTRQRRLSSYKAEYYSKAVLYGYTYEEIGANINLTAAAVAKALKKSHPVY